MTPPRSRSRWASAIATSVLPTPVGSEQGDHLGRGHGPQYRAAMDCGCRGDRDEDRAPGSPTSSTRVAGAAAAARAPVRQLGGAEADLALVFASGAHLVAPEEMLAAVQAELAPAALVGCGAGGVLGGGRELEGGTGVAVWAAASEDVGEARPFHATVRRRGGRGRARGHARDRLRAAR